VITSGYMLIAALALANMGFMSSMYSLESCSGWYGGVDYASIESARRHNRRAKIIKRMR
jgi:hypothetical protein